MPQRDAKAPQSEFSRDEPGTGAPGRTVRKQSGRARARVRDHFVLEAKFFPRVGQELEERSRDSPRSTRHGCSRTARSTLSRLSTRICCATSRRGLGQHRDATPRRSPPFQRAGPGRLRGARLLSTGSVSQVGVLSRRIARSHQRLFAKYWAGVAGRRDRRHGRERSMVRPRLQAVLVRSW